MRWHDDVHVESMPLATTGGHTWKAAYRLAEFLAAAGAGLGLQRPGATLLELGSGTGWLGCTLARNMPTAALCCLTEQQEGLLHLQRNVERNLARGLPLGHVAVCPCDWTHYAGGAPPMALEPANGQLAAAHQLQQSGQQEGVRATSGTVAAASGGLAPAPPPRDLAAVPWDFIVGSDLIYNEAGSRCLPAVLAALATPHTVVLYCHTKVGGGGCSAESCGPHAPPAM